MAVQNHIHLDTTLGASPELAPVTTYRIIDRRLVPDISLSLTRSITGKLFRGVVTDGMGNPLVHINYRYTMNVDEAQLQTLVGLLGSQAYLVDIDHPDDGQDHTAYIVPVVVAEVNPLELVDRMLEWQQVGVYLVRDNS